MVQPQMGRVGIKMPARHGCALWVLGAGLLLLPLAQGGCFTGESKPMQGLCMGKYKVKVCAADQEAANKQVALTHGVIIKANCKKALTILCGGIRGGQPSSEWEAVCCRTANQCETDADCGSQVDSTQVPMCCDYCMEVYRSSCESKQPVNAGFVGVGTLYNKFYGSDVYDMCRNSASRSGRSGCVERGANKTRTPGVPCLGAPAVETVDSSIIASSGGSHAAWQLSTALLALFSCTLATS